MMEDGFRRFMLLTAISSVILQQAVVSFPLPDSSAASLSKIPSILLDAAEDRAGEVVLVSIKTPAAEQSQQPPVQSTTVPPRLLQSVDTLLENEIWQYRYPPFDNLFTNPADDDSDSAESETRGRSPRFNIDSLPSYVIGILDPAELVDGLFQQRPFGTFRSDAFSNRNSVPDTFDLNDADFNNRRDGKNIPDSSQNKIFGVPRIVLDSDDDRWVWRSSSSQ